MTPSDETQIATVIDARGLNCPLPVLKLRKRLKDLSAGTEVTLLATDRAATQDVPAFCRAQGHAVVSADADGEALVFRVRKGPVMPA